TPPLQNFGGEQDMFVAKLANADIAVTTRSISTNGVVTVNSKDGSREAITESNEAVVDSSGTVNWTVTVMNQSTPFSGDGADNVSVTCPGSMRASECTLPQHVNLVNCT